MRKVISIICLISIVILAACSKNATTPAPGDGANFKFSSLTAADTLIKVNAITTITANATGEGLTYQWAASYGSFAGNGSQVKWTVCHEDKFVITCKVTDMNNISETKQIVIRSHN